MSAHLDIPTFCGHVALAGLPNAGKSSLINALTQTQHSIVTQKPQTTRRNIKGIFNHGHVQMIMVDTPGVIEKNEHLLHKKMNKSALSGTHESDVIVLLMDATRPLIRNKKLHQKLCRFDIPLIIAINKIDLMSNQDLETVINACKKLYPDTPCYPISAKKSYHFDILLQGICPLLPKQDWLYQDPNDMIDHDDEFMIAEMIRKSVIEHLYHEIPYQIAVLVEKSSLHRTKPTIHASLWVNKSSHKGIVIGNQGKKLKAIGMQARIDIEAYLSKSINLKLWIKVRDDWINNQQALHDLGDQL